MAEGIRKDISLNLNGNFKETLAQIEASLKRIEVLLTASLNKLQKNGIKQQIEEINISLEKTLKRHRELTEQEEAERRIIEDIRRISSSREEKTPFTFKGAKADIGASISSLAESGAAGEFAVAAMIAAANVAKKIADTVGKTFKTIFDSFGLSFKNMLSGFLNNLTSAFSTTGLASYNVGTSLFSNGEARTNAMTYGLSAGENYGFTMAKSLLNINSDEDLMYSNSAQREKIVEYMQKYSAFYEQMQNSGVLNDIQEIQLEFKVFTQDLSNKFLTWIAANKDNILTLMNTIMSLLELVNPILTAILNVLTPILNGVTRAVSFITKNNTVNNTINASLSDSTSQDELTKAVYRTTYTALN